MTDKNEDDNNSYKKEEIKAMLNKVDPSPNIERNVGTIRVVSLKRNYEDMYPKTNNEDNKNESIAIPVRPPLKQPMLFSNRNEDFEKRNIPLSQLQDKIKTSINESLKYYQNKSKIVFASESKKNNGEHLPSGQNDIYQTNRRQQMQNNIYNNNQFMYESNSKTNPFITVNNQNKSKKVVVIIKPSLSNELPYNSSNRSLVTQALITLIGSGVIIVIFLYSLDEENRKQLLDSILSINPYRVLFCGFIIAGALVICKWMKEFQDKKFYYEIAAEDLKDLENRINKSKGGGDFIGVFQSQFIKEKAESRGMTEGKYIKKILPLIIIAIQNKKNIKETSALISSQEQKIWVANNDMELI